MFISIVIPTFNRPGFLAECLAPIAAQTAGDGDIEVNVVDDGSEPVKAAANKNICSQYKVNYAMSEKNQGMAVTRNTGIARSRGEWIVFIDDDFRVADNWYRTLVPLLRQQPAAVAGVEGKVVPAGDGLWDREVQNLQGGLFITCHIAFRKNVLDAIGGFDPHFEFEGPFCEDHELAVRVLRRGSIVFAPGLTGEHLPRQMKLWSYMAASFKRVRLLLCADYYFFCKQCDWYHRFRHSRTFWGTFVSLLMRNVFSNLRRRRIKDSVRHPIQLAALFIASCLEQIGAWFLIPYFLSAHVHDRPCYFYTLIDTERTARFWRLPDPAKVAMLQFPLSNIRSLLFPVFKLPGYDKRPLMRRISNFSELDSCKILLRIDDVFMSPPERLECFIRLMAVKKISYLACITGNDLIDPQNLPAIARMRENGAEIAIHGFKHTGQFGPFESEILQMKFPELSQKIAAIMGSAAFKGHPLLAFVPPYNAIAGEQIAFLARIFDVVTGGPETMRFSDRFAGPVAMKNGGWYIPTSYPFYSTSRILLRTGVIREIPSIRGIACLSLHMTEEAKDGFVALKMLLDALPYPPILWRTFARTLPGPAADTTPEKGA